MTIPIVSSLSGFVPLSLAHTRTHSFYRVFWIGKNNCVINDSTHNSPRGGYYHRPSFRQDTGTDIKYLPSHTASKQHSQDLIPRNHHAMLPLMFVKHQAQSMCNRLLLFRAFVLALQSMVF